MKRKLFIFFLTLVASVGTMFAGNVKIGDFYFKLNEENKTAEVTYAMDFSWSYNNYSGLTTVTIPESVENNSITYLVTSIGDYAFCECIGLTSIEIPNSVTSIGTGAFSYCPDLTSIEIPNSVTSIKNGVFTGCSSLTSPICIAHIFAYMPSSYSGAYTIPDGIESIAGSAFYGCSGLTSIEISDGVTSIGYHAFYGCSALMSVDIPNSVTSIEEAFLGCKGLKQATAPALFFDIPETYWPNYTQQLDSVIITKGELTDNMLGFVKRSYKTLKTLDVSATTNTSLPDEAFKDCYNLQTLVLPANLENVSYMAVAGCKNLKAIDIPASVEEIEQSAFEDCRSIETITFGGVQPSSAPGRHNAPAATASQLHRIGNWAFYNAHELQHLTLPEGVEEIGDGAFYGCTYLEDLVLPSSVHSIGDNCFALCSKLTKITVNSTTPPEIQAKTFYDVKRQIPVYVPDDCVDAYTSDQYWGEFNIIGQSETQTGIDNVSSSLQGGERGRLILCNGQILILRGDKTYTLQGQELR